MDTRIWGRLPHRLVDRIVASLPAPAFFRARRRLQEMVLPHLLQLLPPALPPSLPPPPLLPLPSNTTKPSKHHRLPKQHPQQPTVHPPRVLLPFRPRNPKMVPPPHPNHPARVLPGVRLRRTHLLRLRRGRVEEHPPLQPARRLLHPAAVHFTPSPLSFRRSDDNRLLHRHGLRRGRHDLALRRQEPDFGKLPHRQRRLLLRVGHDLGASEALQPRVGPDGARLGPILLHELQPVQRFVLRHRGEPVVQDPGAHAEVPEVAEPGGEPGEAGPGGGGREE
ncbi:protein unusual floral organs [Phtheirospermum japonicum]|uniref:Protein unusual floral organs n=1 Tax=Phtheirospermum japonicum TaxID=374723 RepID=A0A830CYC3_9LAMI|nr:protein unusual floral organs [Phtheirospermum japonicum]